MNPGKKSSSGWWKHGKKIMDEEEDWRKTERLAEKVRKEFEAKKRSGSNGGRG